MLRDDDRFVGSFQVIGGPMLPQGHLQLVVNLVDSELNPQAALEAPRFRYLAGTEVALETSRFPASAIEPLRARGHDIVNETEYFQDRRGHWGGGQVITAAEDGMLIAGSDPRKDGQAVGY